uniref:Uncharacterized protein n=1 Tax=Emiliania huxleyi (strain CCMP1516) TaxID=280463 RepID=A0A0D3IPJ1_EMIH1
MGERPWPERGAVDDEARAGGRALLRGALARRPPGARHARVAGGSHAHRKIVRRVLRPKHGRAAAPAGGPGGADRAVRRQRDAVCRQGAAPRRRVTLSGGHADRRPARLVGGRRPRDPHEHPPRPPRSSRHAASDSPSRAFSRGAAPSHRHCAPRAAAAAAAAARPRAARDHGVGGVRGRGGLRIKERSTRSTLDAPCRRRAGRRLRRVRSCSSSRGGQFCQIRVRNSIR